VYFSRGEGAVLHTRGFIKDPKGLLSGLGGEKKGTESVDGSKVRAIMVQDLWSRRKNFRGWENLVPESISGGKGDVV